MSCFHNRQSKEMDSVNLATSAAGPLAKRPLRETGEFFALTPKFLTQRRGDAKSQSVLFLHLSRLCIFTLILQIRRCRWAVDVLCFGKSMSEFKYACPVCGQHISCDSSQAGSQMECPTCFQKITVPQAPASEGDQKFILTGTKKSERPVPTLPEDRSAPIAKKSSLAVALILLVLICAAGAAVFAFRGKIFKSHEVAGDDNEETNVVAKAGPVAPPASDANWLLDLTTMTNIPDATVAGRIHGENFIIERAVLQNGTLTLREGKSGPVALGLQINFGGAQPEGLAGQTLNITTNAPMAARVTMIWTEGSQTAKSNLQGGYAMRLNFEGVNGNRIAGKIYFCAPDDSKSYVMGAFNAEIRKPKPPKTR
jgi:DNA-directed RNA polymerase subunit RPC12/RpoP